jgi:hypothetical protein
MDTNSINLAPSASTETVKMEQDFSSECDAKIPEAQALAKTNLPKAIEDLLSLEKLTRVVSYLVYRIIVSVCL